MKKVLIGFAVLFLAFVATVILSFFMCNNKTEPSAIKITPLEQVNKRHYHFQDEESAASKAGLELVAPIAQQYIDAKKDLGIILAVVTPDGVSTKSFGSLESDEPYEELYGEIGSLTKPFVGLAFASLINDGVVKADTKLAECLPKGVTINGIENITLAMLAAHIAGIPRLPKAIADKADTPQPYADFSDMDVFTALKTAKLNSPGYYEYSNWGAALLAQALTICAGEESWETLIANRVTKVLRLKDIKTEASPLMQGHDASLKPVPDWHFKGMGPAGALKANIKDLAKLAQMMISDDEFAGKEMIKTSLTKIHSIGQLESALHVKTFGAVGLFWHMGSGFIWDLTLQKPETKEAMHHLVFHNGQTAGATSGLAVIPEKKIGIVMLSNTASPTTSFIVSFYGLSAILGEDPAHMKSMVKNFTK